MEVVVGKRVVDSAVRGVGSGFSEGARPASNAAGVIDGHRLTGSKEGWI
jgi:hypothetical protein